MFILKGYHRQMTDRQRETYIITDTNHVYLERLSQTDDSQRETYIITDTNHVYLERLSQTDDSQRETYIIKYKPCLS